METSVSTGEPQAAFMAIGAALNICQTSKVETINDSNPNYVSTLPIPAPRHIKGFTK